MKTGTSEKKIHTSSLVLHVSEIMYRVHYVSPCNISALSISSLNLRSRYIGFW